VLWRLVYCWYHVLRQLAGSGSLLSMDHQRRTGYSTRRRHIGLRAPLTNVLITPKWTIYNVLNRALKFPYLLTYLAYPLTYCNDLVVLEVVHVVAWDRLQCNDSWFTKRDDKLHRQQHSGELNILHCQRQVGIKNSTVVSCNQLALPRRRLSTFGRLSSAENWAEGRPIA